MAQEVQTPAQPTINLSLPLEAVQVIMNGLGQLPLSQSINTYQYVGAEAQRQVEEHNRAMADTKKATADKQPA